MDLITARTELKARGFDYLPDSRVNLMLNNAKNELEDYFEWPWLETTATTGTAPLTIADLRAVLYVLDTTNDNSLTGIDPRTIPELDGDPTTTGVPQWWWLNGLTQINVYPVSTTVQVSVRYLKYSPELSSSSDTAQIPARYHPVWLDLAAIEAYKDDDQYPAAQALRADVNQRLEELVGVFMTRNDQGPDHQVITAGSWDW